MVIERAVEIQAALKGFEQSMAKKRAALPPAGRKALYLWADGALGKFKVDRLSGGGGLKVMSGDLRRSFHHRESGEALNTLRSVLFTTSKYAAIHEFGGTIKPKKAGGKLAIPLKGSPATRASGEPLYHSPLKQTLPQHLDFFVHKSDDGDLTLMDKTGQAWFALVSSVFIPPRMRFRETIKSQILGLQKRLKAQFGAALKSG